MPCDLLVIIAFSYSNMGELHLPCCIVDAYRVYTECGEPPALLITDSEGYECEYNKLGNDLSFFNLNGNRAGKWPDLKWIVINSIKDLISSVQYIIGNNHHCIFYYSGHASHDTKGEYLLLPSGEELSMLKYRNLLLHKIPYDAQVLWILDCCYAGSMSLQFKREDDNIQIETLAHPTKQHIICLSSSCYNQKSLASPNYSYFTKYIFQYIKKSDGILQLIVDLTRCKLADRTSQVCNVFLSRPHQQTLWLWVFSEVLKDIYVVDDEIILVRSST